MPAILVHTVVKKSLSHGKIPCTNNNLFYMPWKNDTTKMFADVLHAITVHFCEKPIHHLKAELFFGHIFRMDDYNCWTETILANRNPHIFKFNTGASVTVVSEKRATIHKLSKPNKWLKDFGNIILPERATLKAKLRHKDQEMVPTLCN